MAKQFLGPRKQRTRQHVIADQSVHYVEGFILAEGHTAQRLERDYGYDLLLFTYDEQGYVEPGFLFFQVKAAEEFQAIGSDYVFDLDVRDYNLWMLEETPVILVLFDATRRRASWLAVQDYFHEDRARRPRNGAKTVRVRMPMRHAVNRRAIAKMRDLKWESLG
jgi:Domain of unknown function (DUF4365)